MDVRIGVVCSVGVGATHGGRGRNEDNYLVCHGGTVRYLENGAERAEAIAGEGTLIAVCDGMGGHDDGHVASLAATKVLSRLYQPGVPPNPERVMLRYVVESHKALHWKAAEQGPVSMGTTVTVAWLLRGTVSWVNVGDSRLYRFRGDEIELLTLDQTANEFARRDGRTVITSGDHLAQNFIYGSRGLGDNDGLRLQQGLDTGTDPVAPGDVLLLCSDGVWAVLEAEDLERILHDEPDPQSAANLIARAALTRGTTDNLTAIVARIEDQAPPQVDWSDDFDVLKTL